MGQALYRKYRSKSLSEIVGQEHITQALQQAIKTGRISHAYLFTGPKGVGKTSIARILAHEINGLPYNDDTTHLDIIEIDAASNRRIDEIRDLREKVYVAPTSAKYKVYIIDEVHMLTREAFNALLKTLEEPPAHVVFILATTDAHKLPETIVSRTQRYSFRPVEKAKVVAHLRQIAQKEKIDVSDEALELLAEHGEGSFRDSISMLDQAGNHASKIGLSEVRSQLGIPPADTLQALLESLSSGDIFVPVQALQTLYEQGFQAAAIASQLGQLIRSQIAANQLALELPTALQLLSRLLEVPASHDPERFLEIVVMETAGGATPAATTDIAVKAKPAADKPGTAAPLAASDVKPAAKPKAAKASKLDESKDDVPPTISTTLLDEAVWPQVLAALKLKYNTIYGIVRMAHPDFSQPGKIELSFAFAFHQKRINDAKNRKIVADAIEEVTGQRVEIHCVVNKDLPLQKIAAGMPEPADEPGPNALDDISNIFGGGELL